MKYFGTAYYLFNGSIVDLWHQVVWLIILPWIFVDCQNSSLNLSPNFTMNFSQNLMMNLSQNLAIHQIPHQICQKKYLKELSSILGTWLFDFLLKVLCVLSINKLLPTFLITTESGAASFLLFWDTIYFPTKFCVVSTWNAVSLVWFLVYFIIIKIDCSQGGITPDCLKGSNCLRLYICHFFTWARFPKSKLGNTQKVGILQWTVTEAHNCNHIFLFIL